MSFMRDLNARAYWQYQAYLNLQTSTHANSAGSHAGNGGGQDDEVEEVTARPTAGGIKRSRGADVQELPAAKRRGRPSEHEQRLMGRFDVPATAKAIDVPTYDGNSESRLRGRSGKMGGPTSFTPMNSLNRAPHAANSGRAGIPRSDSFKEPGSKHSPEATAQLQTTTSRGDNVRRGTRNLGKHGDGFQPNKKRKTTHFSTAQSLPSSPVDLTEKDEAPNGHRASDTADEEAILFANVVPPVSRAASLTQSTTLSRTKSKERGPFGESEFIKSVAVFKPGPNRRKGEKDPSRRSRISSQTPSVVSVLNGNGVRETGSRNSPVALDDEDDTNSQLTKSKVHQKASRAGERIPIDLGDGVELGANGKVRQGSKTDHEGATRVMNNARRRWDTEIRKQPELDPPPLRTRRTIPQDDEGTFAAYAVEGQQRQAGKDQQKLREKFVRDRGRERKPRASQRMLESSKQPLGRVTPVDDSVGSLDELPGEQTVGVKASRNASPVKDEPGKVRVESPSDLKTTQFTQARESASSKRLKGRRAAAAGSVNSNSCLLHAFYSKAYCTQSRGQKLVYDPRLDKLELWEHQMPAMIVGGKRPVTISYGEAHKVMYSSTSHRVYLTGSQTDVSHGSICIAFPDQAGVEWLLKQIGPATKDLVTYTKMEGDRLDKVFAHQSHEILQAYNSARSRGNPSSLTRAKSGSALKKLTGHRIEKGAAVEEDEYQTKYDEEEQPEQPKRRAGMLGVDGGRSTPPQRAPASGEQSRFFPPMGATRRSTRERKPVQERVRTPSPERWTEVNKPKRWSKPVEYPPQGLQRVTVDFGDLERLDEGQFLNDNVISFGLRKIEEEMAPEYRDSIHCFNTFFYTSLTTKNGKKVFNYDSVKKWTKNKDIFSIPYVVVPINIDLHWFVAIICNLDKLNRKAIVEEDDEPQVEVEGEVEDEFAYLEDPAPKTGAEEAQDDSLVVTGSRSASEQPKDNSTAMKKLSISESEHASPTEQAEGPSPTDEVFEFGENAHVAGATSNDESRQPSEQPDSRPSTAAGKLRKGRKKSAPRPRKYDPDTVAVMTLDSFGSSHTGEVRTLKDYVINEADTKRSMAVLRDQIQGVSAKGIPQQTNFCDCGVYLLGYIEQFAKDPRAFAEKVLSKELDEGSDFANFDPSAKRAEIRDLLLKLNEEQEAQRKELKKAKAMGQAAEQASTLKTPEPANSKAAPAPVVREQPAKQQTPARTTAPSVKASQREAPARSEEEKAVTAVAQPGAADGGHDNELEVAPARPLEQSHATGLMAPFTRGEFNGSEASDDDNGKEEMLDDPHDPAADPPGTDRDESAGEGPYVLSSLEKVIAEKAVEPHAAISAEPLIMTDEQTSSPEEETEEDLKDQSRQQPLDIVENQLEHVPEVADSQEAAEAPAFKTGWKGQRTTFNDE